LVFVIEFHQDLFAKQGINWLEKKHYGLIHEMISEYWWCVQHTTIQRTVLDNRVLADLEISYQAISSPCSSGFETDTIISPEFVNSKFASLKDGRMHQNAEIIFYR